MSVPKSRIHRGIHDIPELVIVVDDGIDLLATGHGRGENCANGERRHGDST